jgi:amino acid adenylation domain-containing protein
MSSRRAEAGGPPSWDELSSRLPEKISGEEYYRRREEHGVAHAARVIAALSRGEGEALAELVVPEGTGKDRASLPPAIFDACLHVLAAAASPPNGDRYTPLRIGRLVLAAPLPGRLWAHAHLGPRPDPRLGGDVLLYDEGGGLVAELRGLELEPVPQSEGAPADVSQWLYEPVWRLAEHEKLSETVDAWMDLRRGSWLVFADEVGVGEELSRLLGAQGARAISIRHGDDYRDMGSLHFHIRPGRPEDLRQVMEVALPPEAPPCLGVVHLWSIDAAPAESTTRASLEDALQLGCLSVLSAVQELLLADGRQTPRLWLVTRGAQPVGGTSSLAIAQSPLWGFGRTLAQEHAALWGGLVDLDPAAAKTEAASQLFDELWWPDGEGEVAWRGSERYVARLTRKRDATASSPVRWRPDGTYLVSGGLGGLGLLCARWMVEQGARRLVLLGRTRLPPRSRWTEVSQGTSLYHQIAAIREIEAMGASVHVAGVDVSEERELSAFLEEFRREGWPPIRGVIHAAGLLQDRTVLRLDAAAFSMVFRPKVVGAWLLDRLLENDPLDFFLSFSSAASLLGSPGQANYSAANAFLDALSHHRRARGRVAQSLNWGPWAEVGLAAWPDRAGRLALQGVGSIAPGLGLDVLGRLLSDPSPQVGVIPIDWKALLSRHPEAARLPMFAELVREARQSSQEREEREGSDILTALRAAPHAERLSMLQRYLSEAVAQILRIPLAALDADQLFARLGIDSLMAVELKNRVELELAVVVPIGTLLRDVSVKELAAKLLQEVRIEADAAVQPELPEAPPQPISEHPLSYGQRALWFLHKLAPESAAYNVAFAVRIRAKLDTVALRKAFEALSARHAALRTTFAERDGVPLQQVYANPLPLRLEPIDVSGLDETEMQALVLEDAQRPFDLRKAPLGRLSLYSKSPRDQILLFTAHHICIDLWSLVVLMDELRTVYTPAWSGGPSSLRPLTFQYPDYSAWQAEMLTGPEGERLWDYWRKQLSGELNVLHLPTDRPRPKVQTFKGAVHRFQLSEDLTRRIKALSKAQGATLYTTLLAAFQVLLYRYSGQERFFVGSPAAGRSRASFEGVVGYFVNPVVLRGDLSGEPTFREYLAQVRQTVLGALEHQDFPFPLVVERLQRSRDPSRSPLFDVMFVFQRPHRLEAEGISSFVLGEVGPRMDLGKVEVESYPLDMRIAQFDLTLTMLEAEESLQASLHYNVDLFDDSTMARLSEQFVRLLEGLVADPEAHVSKLAILPERDRRRLLLEWNDTRCEVPALCIPDLFERQAKQVPEKVAVEGGGARFTYRELDARANRLAHHLRELGVGPEVLVGVCMERSPEMVAALLGILRAGGAYVPLDPAFPVERLRFMIDDSRLAVLITEERLRGSLPPTRARIVSLDREADAALLLRAPDRNPRAAKPDHLAYVLYTSGSTGRPKGVQITHRAVVNFLESMKRAPGLAVGDRFLAVTTFSFDIAALEIFLPLSVGATVVLASRETALDGPALGRALRDQGITAMQATPATWRMLVDSGWEGASGLKALCGGEALPRDLASALLDRCGALWNLYGPTETTIWSTVHYVEPGEGGVPIGRPVANTQVYILDAHLEPVPVNVVGELYIGGHGLARGYLGRPDLTAERFITDPFGEEPGLRLYRTGDLARWRSNGTIEFVGRADHQVKVRGFRIELGEIEAVLAQHSAIRQSVAVTREDVPGDKRLIAYWVPRENARVTAGELRELLKESLPEYMIPTAFVCLEALPLTPNGKVDRRALPAPTEGDFRTSGSRALRSPIEQALGAIWKRVLGVAHLGGEDNFFDLGGHSLLATQVVARVRDAFGVEIPLRVLFEAPTVAELGRRVEEALTAQQGVKAPALVPFPRDGELPLSFSQQRLWFLAELEPGSAAYNIPGAVRLTGVLQVEALRQSLEEIERRHESLRTTFASHGGRPRQVIAPPKPFKLAVEDVTPLEAGEQEAEVRRVAEEEALRPFDLERGPLWRAVLVRVGPEEHVLFVTLHHIISDGWSMAVLTKELAALYEAAVRGVPVALPDLPVQYADYAAWQRGWLTGDVLERELAYWKKQLAGELPLLELPSDRPRPAVQSYAGASEAVELAAELVQALEALGRSESATLFMTVTAAFALLLSRYARQEEILLGTPIANRSRVETEGLIGFFVNTLVLRTDLGENPTFRELLRRVRETALGAYAHPDVPFEKLVEELGPKRALSHSPLFQAMLAFENAPAKARDLGDVQLRLEAPESRTSKFDLTLFLWEAGGGKLAGMLEYSTDLFDRETMVRLTRHFGRLLAEIAAHPDERIGALPMLSAGERAEILARNETKRAIPSGPLPALLEAQAERTPEAVAVVFEGRETSYAELHRRANGLAAALAELGVGPGALVGLCVERSLEMVVGLLGILKAGGAYVPLDPAYPEERQRLMLEDSHAAVVVTVEKLRGKVPGTGARILCVEETGEREKAPSPRIGADDLAYVIYTSGSTGRPKGVAIPHGAVMNLLESMRAEPGFTASDTLVAVTTLSFDIAGLELYLPLVAGGKMVVASREVAADGAALARLLGESGATVMQATPATWRALLLSGWKGDEKLRILCGGEAFPRDLGNELSAKSAGLWNVYGPTETTIWSMLHAVEVGVGPVPIGRPIANTEVFVVDALGELVPDGVSGELWIGGRGLAREYWERPELTAEKFIESRHGRVYRTGDLARWRRDGAMEFLGRLDDQVKLRGHRIELGEVESVLRAHPGVREAAVALREERLVAYVVGEASASELKALCGKKLPEYMVPQAFVTLEALPLTPNGKVNRRALPAPERGTLTGGVAPRTGAEEVLSEIWAEVLGLPRVGVEESFFDLGGHSLLATQVVARVRDAFGVEIPLRVLFEAPTVAELGRRVEEALTAQQGVKAPALVPFPRDGELPLSFSQQRLWFLAELEPGSAAYNIPGAVRLTGVLQVEALRQSLEEIERRHESLRTTFANEDGRPRQVISRPRPYRLPVMDLTPLDPEERAAEAGRLAAEEALRPFDLERGPLWRAVLLRLGPEEHALLLTVHHIISDGWSTAVLTKELAALYEAAVRGVPAALPDLPVQYADYAVWQRGWLAADALERELAYWKKQLAGELPLLELPSDRPRPAVQSYAGASESIVLPPDLVRALEALGRSESATLFMTLTAAFALLLSRYSGQEDILLGTPIANRTRVETEGLVGLFVNTLVLRADLSGDPSFRELLRRVRDMALGAYAHPDIPFEKLVEELRPARDLSRNPIFDVLINFVGQPAPSFSLPGLEMQPLEMRSEQSKFALTLYASMREGALWLGLTYQQSLFSDERIRRILAALEKLVTAIAASPDEGLSAYSLLTAEDLALLPDPRIELAQPVYERVADMIRDVSVRVPTSIAVRHGARTLSYGELFAGCDALARALGARGLRRGDVVAVTGVRSPGFIGAMCGVLQSGGVLLTLDPKLPLARRELMLREAQAKHLILVGDTDADLPDRARSLDILRVDPPMRHLPESLSPALPAPIAPGDPAYVFFTSGTTGVPKAVLGCHKGLSHFLTWQRATFGVHEGDRCAQLTGLSFDVLLRDVFLPLTSGATLCLPDDADDLGPRAVLPFLAREGVTRMHVVPSLVQAWLLDVPPGISLPELRTLFFAGEPLTDTLVRRWREAFPGLTEIVNLYGPTETTLAKCCFVVPAEPAPGIQPVGFPLPETQALVLGKSGGPCAVGEPGEIVIRTPFRSLGYLRAPEETRRRFIPNPFSQGADDLLYRTGDRGRVRADGALEILGRADNQVKIRGMRVELEEIESVLGDHPGVGKAVVVARRNEADEKDLVAYVVPRGTERPAAEDVDLLAFLRARLPAYMVPSAFVHIEAIPLSPNGKVNRRALPDPEPARFRRPAVFVAPRDPWELDLVRIFEEVLGRSHIGVTDDFFDIGGHSLLAVRLVAHIQRAMGRTLPISVLFAHGTVEKLAALLRHGHAAARSTLVPIQPQGEAPPLFFAHPIGGNVLCYLELSRELGAAQPFYGLEAVGVDDERAPLEDIEAMAAHHLQEVRSIQPRGPYHLGGWSMGGLIAFEMARQLREVGEAVELLALVDTVGPELRDGFEAGAGGQVSGAGGQVSGAGGQVSEDDVTLLLGFARDLGGRYGRDLRIGAEDFVGLAPEQRLEHLLRRAKEERVVAPGTEAGELRRLLEVARANLTAARRYRPRSGVDRLLLLTARESHTARVADLALGWQSRVGAAVEVRSLAGDHYSILSAPNVQAVAAVLREGLAGE